MRNEGARRKAGFTFLVFAVVLALGGLTRAEGPPTQPVSGSAHGLPTVGEMIAARTDVWGEAAMRRSDGASYEFFADLLPPLRYADTEFRHYPIVFSAPLAAQKARLISNGSAVNARANKKPMWREIGVPVTFHVGQAAEVFGDDIERLNGPRYADGYLPIVRMTYRSDGTTYEEEVFAPVEPAFAEFGAVLVRFTVGGAERSRMVATIGTDKALEAAEGVVRDEKGNALLAFDSNWRWNGSQKALEATFESARSAVLAVFTQPAAGPLGPLTLDVHEKHREACAKAWNDLLSRGVRLETPEAMVNDAWRSMIVGNYMIAVGDRMNYSAGNAYDHLYEAECGDAVRSLLLYGFAGDARKMIGPLLDFQRQATRFHVAGHKLQLLSYYYWITRDAAYMKEKEAVWKGVIDFILKSREAATGLLPKDRYAGDINEAVYSTNSIANSWRGLRDIAAVLDDLGRKDEAARIAEKAAEFRKAILDAVAKSERRETKPPFIPMALLSNEAAPDPLTATRKGSYYNLMVPYVIGSEVFGQGSQREDWLLGYQQQHGGIAMGMIRSEPHQGQFDGEPGVNVLYGLRYILALLRRDDRERAIVGFYGHLAQAMTRETFIGGEGSRFVHGDEHGRSFYLPPNSASNAMFLMTLRYLLVQDWDLDEDGKPETLRLLYGVPRRWLADGATITLERAPTPFGAVSINVASRLSAGEVAVKVVPPPRAPERMLLRLPLPSGWIAVSASVNGEAVALGEDGAADLTGRGGALTVRFTIEPTKPRGTTKATAGRRGLYVEDGVLKKDGQAYRAIGVNYFSAFLRTLLDPADTSYRDGFAVLGRRGIPFARFLAGGFWPADFGLYAQDKEQYFRRFDDVVQAAEASGVGLIPSLFWYISTVPDLVGEPCDQWGNPESKTHAWMRQYVRDVVTRYRNSPTIWGWEFGNEFNLAADIRSARHRPFVSPPRGTPTARTERDDLTHDMVRTALQAFAREVRKYDTHRVIFSGNSAPRPSAWHLRAEGKWIPDTKAQYSEMLLADNPDPMDAVCIHYYDSPDERRFDPPASPVEFLEITMDIARRANKPLFLGEFGTPDGPNDDVTEKQFCDMLAAVEKSGVPLAALWVYDLPQQKGSYHTTFDNDRAYQLEAVSEANRRIRKASKGGGVQRGR